MFGKKHSDEGSSSKKPLLHDSTAFLHDKWSSATSAATAATARIGETVVHLENFFNKFIRSRDVQLDIEEDSSSESLYEIPTRKIRPLMLTDNYEIVGGIPSFTWKNPEGFNPDFWNYALSLDGTILAIQEDYCQICVYDVTNGFALLAECKQAGSQQVLAVAFWKDTKDKLIVCYDGLVGLYSIELDSDNTQEEFEVKTSRVGSLKLLKEQEVISRFRDLSDLCFSVTSFETTTWLCGRNESDSTDLVLCCLDDEQEGFKTIKLSAKMDGQKSLLYFSPIQGAVMRVQHFDDPMENNVEIWKGLDFSVPDAKGDSFVVEGKCFGWSADGACFLVWEVNEKNEQHLKVYSMFDSEDNGCQLEHSRPLEAHTLDLKAIFLNDYKPYDEDETTNGLEVWPFVAYLQTTRLTATLNIWDANVNRIVRELDFTINNVEISKESHIEFCISPNFKWVAVRYWNPAMVALFSFVTGALVWNKGFLVNPKRFGDTFPLQFDPMSSRLIIDAFTTLYALAPACFIEDYEIDYECSIYNMDLRYPMSFLDISSTHKRVISNRMMWNILDSKKGPLELDKVLQKLDIANSIISNKVVLLIRDNNGLLALYGPLRSVFVHWYKMCFLDDVAKYPSPQDMEEIRLDEKCLKDLVYDSDSARSFVYLDSQTTKEAFALFCLKNAVACIFIDLRNESKQQVVKFSDEEGFQAQQMADCKTVNIITSGGVMSVDLCQKAVIRKVSYEIDLKSGIEQFKRDSLLVSISSDGASILIGWEKSSDSKVVLDSTMTTQELEELFSSSTSIIECGALSNSFEEVMTIECTKETQQLLASIKLDKKDQSLKKSSQINWNFQTSKVTDAIASCSNQIFDVKVDLSNGCFWIIVLQSEKNHNNKLFVIPVGPYCMDNCLPSLIMRGYPKKDLKIEELNKLTLQFGTSFLNIPFNTHTNFQIGLENKDDIMISKFLEVASKMEIPAKDIWNQCWKERTPQEFLKATVEHKDEEHVKFLVDLMKKKCFLFTDNATMIKECFENLWLSYRSLVEEILLKDILVWKVGELSVPSDLLHNRAYIKARLGTSDSITEWFTASREGTLVSYWRSSNKKSLEDIEKQCKASKEKVVLKFFCMKDACKIGLNGILRFLLMQEAPSYIYKTALVKWIITWKWENIWKQSCLKDLLSYVGFSIAFSVYAICIGYIGEEFNNTLWAKVFLSILLAILMYLALALLGQEYVQIQTYVQDGKKLFPNDYYWGVKKYFQSVWNILEATTYIFLLTVVPLFHLLSLFIEGTFTVLLYMVAFGVLMVWIKFWYFAQAFQRTGALVLMIENVIKDCTYFLLLALLVLVGFSLALFCIFQVYLKSLEDEGTEESKGNDDNEDETIEAIKSSFSSPIKALLTMFFAMIGTFEPDIYLNSGQFTTICVIILVAYLAIETIVVLNMLIAIMGDTFDRVKHTEEEQLLMGRARFIDACEASLSQKEVEELESLAQTYLYALVSADEDDDSDPTQWEGRVKTISRKMKQDILQTKEELFDRIEETARTTRHEVQSMQEEMIKTANNVEQKLGKVEQTVDKRIQAMEQKMDTVQQTMNEKLEELSLFVNEARDSLQSIRDYI